MNDQPSPAKGDGSTILQQLPLGPLAHELRELVKAAGMRAIGAGVGRLTAANGKRPAGAEGAIVGAAKQTAGKVMETATGKTSGGKGGGHAKVTNIVETIDVGVPVRVAYAQWTRFTDFPSFMKQVEDVQQPSDTELKWRGKVLWSHRDWRSTIVDQVPDRRIVWRSEGAKGYVNGAVTFHELAPELTRILVVLEYYPSGFVEKTANLWRAQGRRARLELKHFRRHVMTQTVLHPSEVQGWRGEIHDAQVTKPPEEKTDEDGGGPARSEGQPEQSESRNGRQAR